MRNDIVSTEDKKSIADQKEREKTLQESIIRRKEQLVEEVKGLNLLSNVFMTVALEDEEACQHVIRVITGIPDLTVREIRSQYRISKLTSHDAILDILAEDGEGQLYNLEIQRQDTIDHARRTRFYAAMIDSEYLMKGLTYSDLPEVHIIYISEDDLWKAGKTVYEVKKCFSLEDTELAYEDGIHVTYLNAAVDDGSEIAKLMRYFKTTDPADMSQRKLSKRVHLLKCEEGGYKYMSEIAEKIYKEGVEDGIQQGIQVLVQDNIEEEIPRERIILKLQKRFGLTEEKSIQYYEMFASKV